GQDQGRRGDGQRAQATNAENGRAQVAQLQPFRTDHRDGRRGLDRPDRVGESVGERQQYAQLLQFFVDLSLIAEFLRPRTQTAGIEPRSSVWRRTSTKPAAVIAAVTVSAMRVASAATALACRG